MSFLSQLFHRNNHPTLVVAAASAVAVGLPFATTLASTAPLGVLQAVNVLAYAINCASVSVPGRVDGQEQNEMAQGKKKQELQSQEAADKTYENVYSPGKGRTLIAPAGWAFAIWGPIYAGEAIFCGMQLFGNSAQVASLLLPTITAPWVAANLFQSLWCASFRPSYMHSSNNKKDEKDSSAWWHKYISVAMLGGTAVCLSQVHAAAAASSSGWLFLPLTLHFGWTTAATLVNLNGSIASDDTIADTTVIGVGHASTVAATLLGMSVTYWFASPAYGLTVAWALAACANGMNRRKQQQQPPQPSSASGNPSIIARGMNVQQNLCRLGSGLCAAMAMATFLL